MFFDIAVFSVDPLCRTALSFPETLSNQFIQFFGLPALSLSTTFCNLINLSNFIPTVNPLSLFGL